MIAAIYRNSNLTSNYAAGVRLLLVEVVKEWVRVRIDFGFRSFQATMKMKMCLTSYS